MIVLQADNNPMVSMGSYQKALYHLLFVLFIVKAEHENIMRIYHFHSFVHIYLPSKYSCCLHATCQFQLNPVHQYRQKAQVA